MTAGKRRRAAMLSARFSSSEAEEIASAAKRRGVSRSQLIRDAAITAARETLGLRPRHPMAPASQSVNVTLITHISVWVE